MKNTYSIRIVDQQCVIEFKHSLCIVILCASTLLLPIAGNAVNNKQQLKTMQQYILTKEKSVQQQQKQRISLLSQLKQKEQSIVYSIRAIQDTQRALATLNRDINQLTRFICQLQDHQAAQQKLLAQQLDASFRQEQYSKLQLILSNEESMRSERIQTYFSYLNKTRVKTINNLRQTCIDLAVQKRKQHQKQQQQVLHCYQYQQQILQSTYAKCQKTLSNLNLSIAKDKHRLVKLHQNEARLRYTIARTERKARREQRMYKKEAAAKSRRYTYKTSKGDRALIANTSGLGYPAKQDLWPVRGSTLHSFGEHQQGELRYKGLIIAAPEGSKVKAIAAGRVLMADWLQGYGIMVVIEHGKNDMSLYGYNQNTLVKVGDQVKAGQPIAMVGASSGQSTPSIYFEIRRQGQAVNPIPWLGR